MLSAIWNHSTIRISSSGVGAAVVPWMAPASVSLYCSRHAEGLGLRLVTAINRRGEVAIRPIRIMASMRQPARQRASPTAIGTGRLLERSTGSQRIQDTLVVRLESLRHLAHGLFHNLARAASHPGGLHGVLWRVAPLVRMDRYWAGDVAGET